MDITRSRQRSDDEPMPAWDKTGTRALRRGRYSAQHQIYHITTCTLHRLPWFVDVSLGRFVVRAIAREDAAEFTRTLAFIVMPDHLHWLLQLTGERSLSTVVRNVKCFSARAINQCQDRSGAVWQRGFHDRALRSDEDVRVVARYVVANPMRAGIVRRVGDYPLWDAVWL